MRPSPREKGRSAKRVALSPRLEARRQDVEAGIRAAGWTPRMVRKVDDDLRQRQARGGKGLPVEWPKTLSLEDVIAVAGLLQAQYRLCMPLRRLTGIPGIDLVENGKLKRRPSRKAPARRGSSDQKPG